jgi:hypothetical protein
MEIRHQTVLSLSPCLLVLMYTRRPTWAGWTSAQILASKAGHGPEQMKNPRTGDRRPCEGFLSFIPPPRPWVDATDASTLKIAP